MNKTTEEGWDQKTIVSLDLSPLFCIPQINRRSLGPIETCNSGPKVAILHAKATNEGWDP